MEQNKYLQNVADLIEERKAVFNKENSITNRNTLLGDGAYPLVNNQWLKIPDVICLFVDIRNSTGLSATTHDKNTASVYELFTGTAVRMFHLLEAGYIDVKGDGVFALFNSNQVHRALVAAVSFKTFAWSTFLPLVSKKLSNNVSVGFHCGIDQKTVLVKQLGIKNSADREPRKNEVWAGKPINMAAKLASRSVDGELLVSDRFYNRLSKNDLAQKTCGCANGEQQTQKVDLWEKRDIAENTPFDFSVMYCMKNTWCSVHGKEWAEKTLALDK